ncbi:pimeloyl-CoA dehydrogenase [Methylobacterium sp. Leaf104]|uniref:pirin family protein n=1 Tax=Methylobacterium TaxID=407 RepID=UPI0006F51E75|nr:MULTISPECIES: pirin family protein [Methylobacterium]KQP42607.1 pimeloyl-CoA dehydrogenase [Methylobacterium sp. Leaf104]MCI9878838.1 pirin family protein [Methylobacterium goesingense]
MDATKLKRGDRKGDPARGFAVEVIYPGLSLGGGDSGLGAIGRIDRATVAPGHVIGMHPHRDDEILTYVRAGRMLHRDTVGNTEEITATRLMMMGAGHTFQHEERMLDSGSVEALQIFLRPSVSDLEPKVQFHEFGEAVSRGAWRLLAAPEGAPLEVRAQAWVSDAHVPAGSGLPLPPLPTPDAVRLLHVFGGVVEIGGLTVLKGETVYLSGDVGSVRAGSDADLVLFATDPGAPVFRGGMFSGNILAR